MIGYIYKCTYQGKIYIGQSLNALSSNYYGSGKIWKSIITGHRKDVVKEILETVESNNRVDLKKLMREREIYWIGYYDSTNPNIGYNISPGGSLMTEESRQKMIKADSIAMKKKMEDPLLRKRISESLKKQRREIGMSESHKKHLSEALKGRNVGSNGDTRSIQVYCVVNNQKYVFHNKISAAKWWYENYPFSDNYAEITYTRAITKSINNEPISYKGKPINNYIQWFIEDSKLSENEPVYCIFENTRYDFPNIEQAAEWWFENYPLSEDYNRLRYITKIHKSIKGFDITYKGWIFNKIKWFKKGN